MRTTSFFHFAFLWVSVLPFCSIAQQPHPAFRNYTTDDGLPSSETYCILQDNQGFIWISTDNGVSRFDGYEFRNFGVKDGLYENTIFHLRLDTKGRVWMQAMSGNLYIAEGESIKPWDGNHLIKSYQKGAFLGEGFIVEGAGDTVHIAMRSRGIFSIAGNRVIKEYLHTTPLYVAGLEIENQGIYTAIDYSDRNTASAYSMKLLKESVLPPFRFHSKIGLRSFEAIRAQYDQGGLGYHAFLLGPEKRLAQRNNVLLYFEEDSLCWHANSPYWPLCAVKGVKGAILVGMHFGNGLKIFRDMEAMRRGEANATWLPGLSVNFIMQDKEGGWWVSTLEQGVFHAPAYAVSIFDKTAGLTNEMVTSIAIKDEDEIWLGLRNGDVFNLDLKKNQLLRLPSIPSTDLINDLFFDELRQTLWVGKTNLYKLVGKNWVPPPIDDKYRGLAAAKRITANPQSTTLWVSSHKEFAGLSLLKNEFTTTHYGEDQRTFIVREDHAGRVWVGRPNGLFELKNDSLHDRRSLHTAFSLRVEDIALAPDSSLVVATKGDGLVFWKGDRFEQITTAQGLTSDMMECIFTDENNVTWAGTLNGLNRISGTWGQRRVEQITTFHGLPSNEINRVAAQGKAIWVATSKGLARFSERKPNLVSAKPILKSVQVGNRLLDISTLAQLSYQENNLGIAYFTINYKMGGRIPYRYRLDGGDWLHTQNRSVNYSALLPGERLFEVQSQNEDGIWSDSAAYRFTIRPPWWATWWFRGLAALALMGAGIGFFRYRTKQLKRENELQRQMNELERSALQAQMNPHFIFNCLGAIQNFILQNEKDQAITYLGSFARLVRGVLNASVSGKTSLQEEVQLLENYLHLEQLRFDHRFDYTVSVGKNLDVFDIEIPPLLIQPYVENAVLHGMTARESGGKVEVHFEKINQALEVVIKDNGVGLQINSQATSTKNHKSVGMSITQCRLELLSDHLGESKAEVYNLLDLDGKTIGVEAKIRINVPS